MLLAPPVVATAEGEEGGLSEEAVSAEMGVEQGEGGEGISDSEEQAALLAGRYLYATGKPVSAASEPGFKRLPVRMRLIMDQRRVTDLVAECANAPLQVEVQEVRINPQDDRGGGGYDERGGGFQSPVMSDRSGEAMTFPQEPNVVPVVIQGTIYIFNEPDPAVLQVDEAAVADEA